MKHALKPTPVRGFPRCSCNGPLALALALGLKRPASTLTCTTCGREVVGSQAMLDRAAKAERRYRLTLSRGEPAERSGEPWRRRAPVTARGANPIRGGPP